MLQLYNWASTRRHLMSYFSDLLIVCDERRVLRQVGAEGALSALFPVCFDLSTTKLTQSYFAHCLYPKTSWLLIHGGSLRPSTVNHIFFLYLILTQLNDLNVYPLSYSVPDCLACKATSLSWLIYITPLCCISDRLLFKMWMSTYMIQGTTPLSHWGIAELTDKNHTFILHFTQALLNDVNVYLYHTVRKTTQTLRHPWTDWYTSHLYTAFHTGFAEWCERLPVSYSALDYSNIEASLNWLIWISPLYCISHRLCWMM